MPRSMARSRTSWTRKKEDNVEIVGFVAFAVLVVTWVVLPIRPIQPIRSGEAPIVALEEAA